jgi:hypothetical protein
MNAPNSPIGEKHEEDNCQDYRDYVSGARLGHGPGLGRQRTYADVLSESVSRQIKLLQRRGWVSLAPHRYAQI